MLTKVIKRKGHVEDFDSKKIEEAIYKAARSCNSKVGLNRIVNIREDVVKAISERYVTETPSVEAIQDEVERALVHHDMPDAAKRFILYRKEHSDEREGKYLVNVMDLVEGYINNTDWRVRENANSAFSVSGLMFHISGAVAANYSLNKYPKRIGDAHKNADIHIHDLSLGLVAGYCAGWDLEQLFIEGINKIPGKISSNPANHLTSATWQMINFIGTLQNEWAGAQAFNSVDTLLAPFIRKDKLNYKQVKQAMQGLVFNLNVPSRWANQCVSSDTEALTENGWKKYNEIKKEKLATFNIETGKIEYIEPKTINLYDYNGKLIRLKNRTQEQLVTPNHNVVRRIFNSDKFELIEAEKLLKYKTPINIPLSGITTSNKEIDDNLVKLIAWIVSEGCFGGSRGRISLSQSTKNAKNCDEIRNVLTELGFTWNEHEQVCGFSEIAVIQFRLNQKESNKIRKILVKKEIPNVIKTLSKNQIKLFIDTYVKGDGWVEKNGRIRIGTNNINVRDTLQELCVLCGYGSTTNYVDKTSVWRINIIRNPIASITNIDYVDYKGKIWCPTTKNGTFVARRNGKVFITGNSPFSNFTFDWTIPEDKLEDIPVIGGKPMDFVYGDLQDEALMVTKAFMEVMTEGDSKGSVLTFPVPTINITKQFDWKGPLTDELFELTAKYGPFYFANFVNSELDPADIRSMCPLSADEKVLIKSDRYAGLEFSRIGNLTKDEYEIYSDGKFVKGKFLEFDDQDMLKIELENGHSIEMSTNHLNYSMKGKKSDEETLRGDELGVGMYLPYSLNKYKGEGGLYDIGFLVGAYAGDGSLNDSYVTFSLCKNDKKNGTLHKIIDISKKYFGSNHSITEYEDSKLVTLRILSKSLVGLVNEYVSGIGREKKYNANLYKNSIEFREGVIDGHLATDGGNRNRIYTSSPNMVESLNMLAASLGTTTSIYKDDREGRLGTEPNYAVLIYKLNRDNYGDFWFKKNKKLWMKIKSIKSTTRSKAYCFEVVGDEPMFTVATTGILTHNCRLSLNMKELKNKMGGLFGAGSQTGSIGVVTINLPKIGYLAKNESQYFDLLDTQLENAKDSLELKREYVTKNLERGLMPYTTRYLGSFRQHFNTIGIIGMHESLINFMKCGIWNKDAHKFAIKIMDHIRMRLIEFQKETGNLYNLEATPAEGTTRRLAGTDRKLYPDIMVANNESVKEGASPYYTNSIHLPVGYSNDLFETLDLEEKLLTKFTGGCVKHIYLGERLTNSESAKNLVRKVCSNYRVPYLSITPNFSVCPIHGYISGEHKTCPCEK